MTVRGKTTMPKSGVEIMIIMSVDATCKMHCAKNSILYGNNKSMVSIS